MNIPKSNVCLEVRIMCLKESQYYQSLVQLTRSLLCTSILGFLMGTDASSDISIKLTQNNRSIQVIFCGKGNLQTYKSSSDPMMRASLRDASPKALQSKQEHILCYRSIVGLKIVPSKSFSSCLLQFMHRHSLKLPHAAHI